MLGQTWLVHVVLPRDKICFVVKKTFAVGANYNRNVPAADVVEKVQDASLFILDCLLFVVGRTVFQKDLPQGDVRQPGIPIPELVLIGAATRRDKRMFQESFGRLEHALVVLKNVLPDDINVVLRFGGRVGAFRGERQAHDQKKDFLHRFGNILERWMTGYFSLRVFPPALV